jgi:hypothetical protein
MSKEIEYRKGKRLYEENPFIGNTLMNTRSGVRRVTNKSGDQVMVVSSETGEITTHGAGFWQTQDVDKTQFVKLYINGVKAFKGLTSAGTKVFEVLYMAVQENIGKDKIYLNFGSVNQDLTSMSLATWTRGLREIVDKGFIASTLIQGQYFINPDYLWNGDRLAFVKEYRLAKPKRELARDPYTIDLVDGIADIEKPLD